MTWGPLAVDEMQSLLLTAFPWLAAARLVLLNVTDPGQARATLRAWTERGLSFGEAHARTHKTAVQLALSARGLAALGVPEAEREAFSLPFQEGIASPHRSRILGDQEANDPKEWLWSDTRLDGVLLAYAADQTGIDAALDGLPGGFLGFARADQLRTLRLADGRFSREHFGFRDGLSQPRIAELRPGASNALAAGEFVLGYSDETGERAPAPAGGALDLRPNGSYLVLRQLRQDVPAFWSWLRKQANGDDGLAVWLAAKLMGRWPNGMPLAEGPPLPQPAVPSGGIPELGFSADAVGLACPRGAHVRRANPRDALGPDPKTALGAIRRHRLLRRGLTYGRPAPAECFPQGVSVGPPDLAGAPDEDRGLLFAALCADVARQFEFVQQTWMNNAKHDERFDEADPIAPGRDLTADARRFSIPDQPFRRRLHEVPHAVVVRGGAYLFVPSRAALGFIAGREGSRT